MPVIDDQGIHRFTVVAKAHQADCGNSEPTTYMGGARDIYHEGALIFPAVKVQQDYSNIDDIVRMCKMRIRVPEQWWGDYLAMIGAPALESASCWRWVKNSGGTDWSSMQSTTSITPSSA